MSALERLVLPVGAAVTLGWLAALADAIYTGRVEVFYVANAPFGLLCGALFARDLLRRGNGGPG